MSRVCQIIVQKLEIFFDKIQQALYFVKFATNLKEEKLNHIFGTNT